MNAILRRDATKAEEPGTHSRVTALMHSIPLNRSWIRAPATIGILLILGLALRIGLAEYAVRALDVRMPDTEIYTAYADTIAKGKAYQVGDSRALRTPGYPAFLAAVWRVVGGPSTRAVLYAQAVLGTITAIFVFCIARSFDQNRASAGFATVSLALALFEPFGLLVGMLELSETLFTTLFAACIWLTRRSTLQASGYDAAVGGLLAGAAILVRPSALLLPPVAGATALVFSRHRRTTAQQVTIAAVALALALSPWWIRNSLIYGQPVWTTLNVGESLYDAWNPRASGGSNMWFTSDPEVAALDELHRDRHWRNEAMAFAANNPLKIWNLALVKLCRFWSAWPNEPRFQTPLIVVATAVPTILVYIFALVGLVAATRNKWGTRPLVGLVLLPVAYFCAMHTVFVSSVRYRVPVAPLLALLAGVGVVWFWHNAVGRPRENTT